METEENYYTYTLAYPEGYISAEGEDLSNKVFYVGKGKGTRINTHESEAFNPRSSNPQKNKIIREIMKRNMVVKKEKRGTFEKEVDAYKHEKALIAFYGLENLTNILQEDHSLKAERQSPPRQQNIRLKIKEAAKEKKISQGKLMRIANVDTKTIQSIFRDPYTNITLKTLDLIACALGVDARELMEVDENYIEFHE